MTPVLLDQRSLFKAGFTLSLGMLVVFFSGYMIGHYQADPATGEGLNKTIALALPRPAHADPAEYEPQIPLTQIPGAYIDVDSPDVTAADEAGGQQAVAHVHKPEDIETVIKATTDIIEQPPVVQSQAASTHQQQLQLAALTTTPAVFSANGENGVIETSDHQAEITGTATQLDKTIEPGNGTGIINTASAEDARYTIQVGVFADQQNAVRRKSELESQNLSAYINEYTNKRDELRFNVRFGYFNNKSSALAALNSFEQTMSGSGYVARIRRN